MAYWQETAAKKPQTKKNYFAEQSWNTMQRALPKPIDTLSLEDQLKQYDAAAGDWFAKVRQAYAQSSAIQTGQQVATGVNALQRGATRAGWSTGGFQSGIGMQAEAQMRQQYGQQELANLAEMDRTIEGAIAQGRLNVTLGYFDYARQLSLLGNQYEYEKRLTQWQVQLAQSNAQSGWSQFFNSIAQGVGMAIPFL